MLTDNWTWVTVDVQTLQEALRNQSAVRLLQPAMSQIIYDTECWKCLGKVPAIGLLCGHYICRICTKAAFNLASKSESFFPPACCNRRIPLSVVIVFVGDELYTRYSRAAIESTTPTK